MTTPTIGTIPALTEYQSGALPIASTVQVEITDSANASTAASYRMSQVDFVGKAPGAMTPANPTASDMVAFLQVATNLPRVSSIGNFGIPSGNLPTGGGTGTFLSKLSSTNWDTEWAQIGDKLSASTSISLSGSTTVAISVANFGISSTQIATNAVGNVQLRQGPAVSVVGVAGAATANVADIIASGGTMVLLSNAAGTAVAFGALTTAYMPIQLQLANITSFGVIYGNGVSTPLAATNFGTTGSLLYGNGSSLAPSFVTISSAIDQINTTQGSLLYRNAATWVGLAGGTAGFVLQTLGTAANPLWVGSGGVLLNTIAASQLGSAVDTTSFTSRYSKYRISFERICPVSTATLTCSLNMQIATSGTTWVSANYVSTINQFVGGTTTISHTTTSFLLSGLLATTCVGTNASVGVNGYVDFVHSADGAFIQNIQGCLNYMTPGGLTTTQNAQVFPYGSWGIGGANAAITGIAIAFQTGNIATGTIKVYGIS